MSKFKEEQRRIQYELLGTPIFYGDHGNGKHKGRVYPFVLKDGDANIYAPILEQSKQYFLENKISWWAGLKPSGHILSSQIACINHLMPFMHDADSVLRMLNGVRNEFDEVLPIPCDKTQAYIGFEVVGGGDYLNEPVSTRGSQCTSIDAFIYAKHKSGKMWIIPIEWKYTEHYYAKDLSIEDRSDEPKGFGGKGKERQRRYNDLITSSTILKTLQVYQGSVYYQEPFYQLMRQTLLSEQMIRHNEFDAVDYLHIHVIPKRNEALLQRKYKVTGKDMETSWRDCLTNQSRYVIIDPQDLLAPVIDSNPDLKQYLSSRYWQ